ncbi:MAG TPA: hypothetical protein VI451_16385, partial [Anaerolineales bacterium]|nr:hypothetical protein [Anaerolineales bacterium]
MNKFLDFDSLLLTRRIDDPLITETLVHAAHTPIYRLVTVLLHNPSRVESITKTILLSALEKLDEYLPGTNFNTWLFTLAMQACRKHLQWERWKNLFTKSEGKEIRPKPDPRILEDLDDKLRLPLILAYGFDLEIPDIAVILNHREPAVQARIEKAIHTLEFPGIEEDGKSHALKAEIARQYPLPPAPPEGFSTLIESLHQQVQQRKTRQPRLRLTTWGEVAWFGLSLIVLAGIYLTFNRTSSDNTTLPLFPSPTPPLPEAIVPNTEQISEQPVVDIEYPRYASEPVISADGRTIVYSVHGNNGQNIHLYDRETGQAAPIAFSPEGNQGYSYNYHYSPDISDNGEQVVFAAISMEGSFFSCPDNSYSSCSQIVLYEREEHTWKILSSNQEDQMGN